MGSYSKANFNSSVAEVFLIWKKTCYLLKGGFKVHIQVFVKAQRAETSTDESTAATVNHTV